MKLLLDQTMRRRDISALHYECNNSRSVSKSDIMTVPPRTGHIVHMFVFILCEMSEQENKFVLCGRILLNTNKTCLTQPLNKKKGENSCSPTISLAFSGELMLCIVQIRPEYDVLRFSSEPRRRDPAIPDEAGKSRRKIQI